MADYSAYSARNQKSVMENIINPSLKSLSSDEINMIEEFRKSKQTAVLAILFSDIVNSTYANEKLGEQTYSKLRHIHDELFKKIMCRDNAGIIIKEIGDSFLCVFAEPSTAVLRAIEFQRAIHSNKGNLTVREYTLTVKIGIHIGQVALENSLALDIFGRHVNRAARIEAIANGGQILTSQSIWENAIGWLKDNNEEKIGWVSYGKTKLKGIDERVDIFGFYPKEIGKPAAPKIILKRKQNRTFLYLSTFTVLVGLIMFMVKSMNKENIVLPAARKMYYVQFDFSEFAKQANDSSQKLNIDTLALSESLLSQIITVLSPDSIITESDLIKSFSRKGKLFVRHNPNDSIDNSNYFRDSLNFSGSIFIKAPANSHEKKDSIRLLTSIGMYYDLKHSRTISSCIDNSVFSLENIEGDFRKKLIDALMLTRLYNAQGYVMSSNDYIILFRITADAKLREGAKISFSREYIGIDGFRHLLNDIKTRIAYFNEKPHQDSLIVKDYKENYAEIEKDISKSKSDSKGSWGLPLEMRGKVIELYDSTGKATWTLTGKYPFEKPKQGDVIYLTY